MTKIAFDTETHGLDWFDGQGAFLASWADADNEYVADLSDPEQTQSFVNALESATELVCHNLPFDTHQTREAVGFDTLTSGAVLRDTALESRVLKPLGQFTHGLKDLSAGLLRPDAKESEDAILEIFKTLGIRKDSPGAYYDAWRAYPEQLEHYAKEDARLTYDLDSKLYPDVASNRCFELEMAVAPILIRAEQTGVAIDQDAVVPLWDEYTLSEENLREELDGYGITEGCLEGPGSRDALLEALLEIGVPLYRKTESGQLATHKFALQEFEDDYPQLAALMEWRRVSKFLSTYLGPMRGRDVLHTSFHQCAAWTGRMSSSRPNLQNLPKRAGREVRRPIVARPGYSLVVSDYDGIEARLLAYYMNDENYRRMFREGLDPHAWMAAQIHGGTMEDFAKDGPNDALRSAAKNTLFAITYGAGAPRVADMNKIDKAEAKELISKIKNSLPKYRRLMGRIRKKVTVSGHVTTVYGRTQMIDKKKAYVGLNALIQGSAADIMKQGLVNADAAVAEFGARPLMVVHDEIVTEAPTEYAEQVLVAQNRAMEAAFESDPPLEVSGSIASNYEEA